MAKRQLSYEQLTGPACRPEGRESRAARTDWTSKLNERIFSNFRYTHSR